MEQTRTKKKQNKNAETKNKSQTIGKISRVFIFRDSFLMAMKFQKSILEKFLMSKNKMYGALQTACYQRQSRPYRVIHDSTNEISSRKEAAGTSREIVELALIWENKWFPNLIMKNDQYHKKTLEVN